MRSAAHDSDPQTVGAALNATDGIRADFDCAAVLCAHVGHQEQWRMKGMIDLEGAIDGATICEKKGEGAEAEFHFKSVFQRHALDGYETVWRLQDVGPVRAGHQGRERQSVKARAGLSPALWQIAVHSRCRWRH